MPERIAWWAAGGAAVMALCVAVGSAAGNDAVSHVDRFYTDPPAHMPRPPMPVSSLSDWNETPTEVAAPYDPSQVITGDARDGGSDLSDVDRAVERAATVRVHRARPAAPPEDGADPDPVVDEAPAPTT